MKINGYTITAQALRKHLQDQAEDLPQETRAHYERQIKVNEFLGSCSEQERKALFDSTAFNDVVKGYAMLAAQRLELDSDTQNNLVKVFDYLFDEYSADQAERYYRTH